MRKFLIIRNCVLEKINKLNFHYYNWEFCCFFFQTAATDLSRCHYGDTDCLKETIGSYAVLLRNGRRDLNLVPIDPLHVDEVNIDQGTNSPVNINLKFRNLKCYGLSQATVKRIV